MKVKSVPAGYWKATYVSRVPRWWGITVFAVAIGCLLFGWGFGYWYAACVGAGMLLATTAANWKREK